MSDPKTLRKDRPTNLIVLAAIASGIALTVATIGLIIPGSEGTSRNDARYWLMMLPVAVFAWSLLSFQGWAMALVPVVLIVSPIVSAALALGWPGLAAADATMLWIATAVALTCLAVAASLFRRSALWLMRKH